VITETVLHSITWPPTANNNEQLRLVTHTANNNNRVC